LNPKIPKICEEIEKTKRKLAEYTSRLRDLERQKTELENADIVSLVRDMDIQPEELTAFIQAFKGQEKPTETQVADENI